MTLDYGRAETGENSREGSDNASAEVRRKLGLKKGDLVAVVETENGVLITRQEVLAVEALDRIGQALRDKGISLEELIESGRDVRSELLQEKYGIHSDDTP